MKNIQSTISNITLSILRLHNYVWYYNNYHELCYNVIKSLSNNENVWTAIQDFVINDDNNFPIIIVSLIQWKLYSLVRVIVCLISPRLEDIHVKFN